MIKAGPRTSDAGTDRELRAWALALVLALGACNQAIGGDHGRTEAARPHLFQRFRPAGGWHPDGGGLWHWWNPYCFPRCGGPDDYCRKPPPNLCRPTYPPFYIGATPELRHP